MTTPEAPSINPTSPETTQMGERQAWLDGCVAHCKKTIRQTALDVVGKILESDYFYGLDQMGYRFTDPASQRRENVWMVYECRDERGKKEVYLTDNGQLRYDQIRKGTATVARQVYMSGVDGEPPLETIAVYANLVGIVEEEAFREKYLAFLDP